MNTKTNLLKSIFISLILVMGVSNAWALDFTQGTVVYFDNTLTQWSNIHLRVGHKSYNSAYELTTKVNGTNALYKYTIPSWGGYDAFSFANNAGETGGQTIYQPSDYKNDSKYPSGQTTYFNWNLDKMRLFIPKEVSNEAKGCTYYTTDVEYNNYQRAVTITAPSNGTITITYTDENGGLQTKTSGAFDVAQTCIITVTATPDSGYELSSLTVGGNNFTSGNTYIVRADATIAATFTKIPTNSLTVKAGEGIASVTGSKDPVTLNSTYPITATLKTGYTFSTWTADPSANAIFENASSKNTNVTVKNGAVTVTATATENTHDVTVSYKYGSTTIKDNTTTAAVGEINAKSITATSITGYTFKEWTLGSGITNKSANTTTSTISITTKESGNYTLTANYDVIPCKFLYGKETPLNNPTDGGKMSYDPNEKAYYIDVTTNNKPYYFQFYYNNSEKWAGNWNGAYPYVHEVTANGDKVNCDQDVIGWGNKASLRFEGESGSAIRVWFDYVNKKAWITTKTYTVTVQSSDINKGTVTPTTPTEMSEATGGTITAAPKTGYHLKEWVILSGSGSFTDESAASTRFKPTAVSTVQANFALNTYSVKFNANGGDGEMADQSFNYNEKKALSTNNFTREEYAFLGWSTTPDGEVEYGDKAEVTNLTTTNNATVTLYAQWLSQTPTYTINFDKQNGTNGTSSATVQYQNNNYSVNPVVAPARTDYTFGGYYTQAEGAGVQVVSASGEWLKSVTGYTDASGNWIKNSRVTTLYAKWISNGTATEGLPTNVYLVGSFGRWDLNDDKQQFKKATADATIYTLTWTFDAAKTYEFKVSVAGEFRGLDNNNEITVEKTSLTIPSTGNNCKITTTEAGEYIFTWDSKTNTLSVEYPSDRVTVTFFGDGGTVGAVADSRVLTSPAKVKPGTNVTFTATPDANNAFSQWKMNGAVVSTNLTYTCAIDADATIEAVFLKPTTVFLKPHAAWKSNNARFAIYYWKSKQDNGWVDLKQLTCHNEYYTADVPVGYSQLKFVRLNPANKDHNFNDGTCWNQTTDLTLPTNGNNLYDLTKIYLKPNAQWKSDEARFAAYFFHSDYDDDKAWMSMLNTDENGVYYCDVPTDKLYNKVSFVRMNGEQSTNDWGNRWNQSKDIDLYNGSNFYTLEEGKWGKGSDGGDIDDMNVIYSGKWTKLELPTITITNTTPDFGDVVVKTTGGRIITNGEKVPFDTKVIVTVTPKNGYKLKTATIDEAPLNVGTPNTICNNTTINVTFAIKEEWYVIGVDGDWETPQERFRFVDGQLEVELDTNITANFKIAYMQGTEILNRYGNKVFNISNKSQTLTQANSNNVGNCTIQTTYYGKYIFAWDAEQKKLTITYPLSVGDYRLAYQDTEDGSFHPERVIKKCIIGDRLDTVSFFVRHDKEPKLVLQQCETLTNGVGTWKTINSNITFTVGKTGVWNFVLQQTNTPEHSVQVLTGEDDIKPYEGDYYIRTKSAKDGWTYFRSDSHKMTYSSYADNNEPFSHYFCKWVSTEAEAANKTKNVRYTIANDYGDCISDTLAADPEDANPRIVTNANGDLPTEGANVRFGWDWETNEIRRAYIAGSTNATENTFLRLDNAIELQNSNKNSVTWIKFEDLQNWIYQVDVIATKSTKVNLTALYNESLQYFKGGPTMTNEQDDRIGLLSSDASNQITFNIRLVYDFKTNHLIVAWLPGNTQAEGALGANMMVIREHGYENGKGTVSVTQLNLTANLTEVDTVYAVMTFDKEWIEKTPRTRDQSIYWVSFPFDVKVSDIFGFGEYADAWILQYYDGAERAEKGLFIDSGTYWKYITDVNTTLKAGVGYVLVLDLNKVTFNHGVSSVSLYFPSGQSVNTISQNLSVDVLVPAHQCNIPYGTIDHKITDSNWNLIGVPAFKDIAVTNVETTFKQTNANFYYDFKFGNNDGYAVKSAATTFKSMYGYMVQYAGTISWSAHSSIPEQIAARRNSESELPEKVVLGLELVQDEEKADQTFVQLQQEGATTDFDMNIDLTKIINSGANIYTLTNDRIQAAGNALPMEEAIVPVGVQITAEGEYTFRMPDGTEGMVVELIDYETNTRTNLLLSDYIVTLTKGTSENRFALHIQPQKDVVTSLENIGEGVNNGEAVNKYLIDGKLIIRTAEGIFDAQGKRL